MDLIVEGMGASRFDWSKIGVFVCFALAAAMLLNSLVINTLTSGSRYAVDSAPMTTRTQR